MECEQELLSVIRHTDPFERLRLLLRTFPEAPLEIEDHELAAEFFNACMAGGAHGTTVDFLICTYPRVDASPS